MTPKQRRLQHVIKQSKKINSNKIVIGIILFIGLIKLTSMFLEIRKMIKHYGPNKKVLDHIEKITSW
jgi:hypothetical protein